MKAGIEDIFEKLKKLKEQNAHFSVLSAYQEEDGFVLNYSLLNEKNKPIEVELKITEKEIVPSVHELFPGAALYETEAHEMLGVKFDKLQRAKLFLPDSAPKHLCPLKK